MFYSSEINDGESLFLLVFEFKLVLFKVDYFFSLKYEFDNFYLVFSDGIVFFSSDKVSSVSIY